MERRTKIVATLGPASDSPHVVRQLIDAGMNMARLSLAHGPVEETLERVRRVRKAAVEANRTVGVLIDLPGPKIRVAEFEREVYLKEDEQVELVAAAPGATSDWRRIAVDHPELVANLEAGDKVSLGDGGVTLTVEESHGDRAVARIRSGGAIRRRTASAATIVPAAMK